MSLEVKNVWRVFPGNENFRNVTEELNVGVGGQMKLWEGRA